MSAGIFKKIGMTRIFVNSKAVSCTVIELQDTFVLQRKTIEKDGYKAVQIGAVKQKKASKAELNHVKKYQPELENNLRIVVEYDLDLPEEKQEITIEDFQIGQKLDLTGKTIGRGYTGAVKRWGFAGQPASHGHDHLKAVGSMGGRWPQRVVKGKKMAGHHGNQDLTIKNVEILAVDNEQKLLFVNGSLPGANSSYLKGISKK
jgi:large subunit ribosomal protein L3